MLCFGLFTVELMFLKKVSCKTNNFYIFVLLLIYFEKDDSILYTHIEYICIFLKEGPYFEREGYYQEYGLI